MQRPAKDKDENEAEGWLCPVCRAANAATRPKCRYCGAPRPTKGTRVRM